MTVRTKATIPWTRVFLEGAVIVVSILLAFGIDAWWDRRADLAETREHLEAVRNELLENLSLIDEQAESCARRRVATHGLLALMGPKPVSVSSDSVLSLVSGALSGGIGNRLVTAALDAMIAEGQFASVESAELRRDLGTWRSSAVEQRVQQRENTRVQLRQARAYAQTIMPFSLVIGQNTDLVTQPESRFPLDVARVLSDATLEGMVSELGDWRESICQLDDSRREQAELLLAAVQAEVGH